MVNENLADKVDDRILWYALQLQQRCKAEIEQAIDRRKRAKEEAAKSRRFAIE